MTKKEKDKLNEAFKAGQIIGSKTRYIKNKKDDFARNANKKFINKFRKSLKDTYGV
tara:strand:- start:418 stop:585 length:168 start_codon:yes stop_codon:yes gene_type:complete